jgi:hypothetical protein
LCFASASSNASHSVCLEQLETRNRQLTTQVKQLVLDFHQQRSHRARHFLAQQHADVRVQLVHFAHGVHAQAVFRDPGVVTQPGGTVIPGAGGNLREAKAHGQLRESTKKVPLS